MLTSSIPAWLTTGFVTCVAAGTLTWAALASYARTEPVQGVVASVQPLAKIMAPRPGIVTRLTVRDGDIIAVGAPLAVVHIEEATETGGTTATSSLVAIEAQRKLAEQRLGLEPARVAAERARLAATINGARGQIAEVDDELSLQDSLIASTRHSYEEIGEVVAKGFITRTESERRHQVWLQAEQQRRSLRQQRDAAVASMTSAQAELARLPIDSAANVSTLHASIEQLAESRAQQSAEQGYTVTAPIAGRVTAVQTAPGRFADVRVPLMTIVPERATMRVDLYAPSRSMGFVAVGQPVRLLYDAFPYQRFGSFGGHIARVSRAVITPAEVDAPLQLKEAVYRVEVALDRQTVRVFGSDTSLQPGMTLTASIVLERRTFLDWLLDPLRAVANRS